MAYPASQLLEAWEQGRAATPGERGLLLLGVAHPELSPETLAGWTVGRRDAALLVLRERLFGGTLAAIVECQGCNDLLEMEFPVSAVTLPAPEPDRVQASFRLDCEGCCVSFRLPTGGDLAALGRNGGHAPGRWLLERCIEQVDHGGRMTQTREGRTAAVPETTAAAVDGLPEAAWEALEAALADAVRECDPQAEVELALTCPSCGMQWNALFDIVNFLWREVDAWASCMLHEVHILASTYGWSERDILALSPWRRRHYLDSIGE